MTFDGIDYRDAGLIYPARHHPGSPLTGPALGNALRIAYCYARRHGRILLTQVAAQDFADPLGSSALLVSSSLSAERIAEGMAYIPRGATHLVSEVTFRVWSSVGPTQAFHRMSVYDGTNTDTGDIASMYVTEVTVPSTSIRPHWTIPNAVGYDALSRVSCSVELATVDAGDTVEISVTGYAAADSGAAITYSALAVRVWWEIRG